MRLSILAAFGIWLIAAVADVTLAADDSAALAGGNTQSSSSVLPDNGRAFPVRANNAQRSNAEDGSNADDVDAETLAFVREHQPELADLLQFLKTKRGSDYDSAIKEIRRVRDRLENLKKRDAELHDVELALWQNSAQLRLWAASVSAASKKLSDADRKKLNFLVTRENELTSQRLKLEKARTEARLELLDQQLKKRQAQSQSMIARGIKVWEGRIERPMDKSKNKNRSNNNSNNNSKTPSGETKTKNTSDRS